VYHYGICDRISPEAAVPVLKQTHESVKKGMSSNVKLNLKAFNIAVKHHTNHEKIQKHRFIDTRYNQHLFRWDAGEEKVLQPFSAHEVKDPSLPVPDAVVFSDYDKGFLSCEVCEEIVEYYKQLDPNIPIFVDTKKKKLTCFDGCIIKINDKEFSNIEAFPANAELIVTIGENGARYKGRVFPTEPVEVFDVCGAGDVFIASLVYGFLKDGNIPNSIALANKMAARSVTHMGTYVLTKEDILNI